MGAGRAVDPGGAEAARFPGRKRLDDRKVLTGILFVLQTGIPWEYLPQEMGCGSGMTCWRRLREWQEAGVWQRLHELLLARLNQADRIDWSRAAIDSSHVRAFGGGNLELADIVKERSEPELFQQWLIERPLSSNVDRKRLDRQSVVVGIGLV